jgi:hypothetical protein
MSASSCLFSAGGKRLRILLTRHPNQGTREVQISLISAAMSTSIFRKQCRPLTEDTAAYHLVKLGMVVELLFVGGFVLLVYVPDLVA